MLILFFLTILPVVTESYKTLMPIDFTVKLNYIHLLIFHHAVLLKCTFAYRYSVLLKNSFFLFLSVNTIAFNLGSSSPFNMALSVKSFIAYSSGLMLVSIELDTFVPGSN